MILAGVALVAVILLAWPVVEIVHWEIMEWYVVNFKR